MSPKDLKTIHFMDEMIEAGVRVFKIEGAPAALSMYARWWNVIKMLSVLIWKVRLQRKRNRSGMSA